jgi:isopentenyl diphosphate isomerase/L-lactate dehydrogenase-like FMN-dependent dehydrogenase
MVLEILRKEFDLVMALSGCPSVSSITRNLCSQRICSV